MIEYKIKNKLVPFGLSDIEAKGYVGHIIDRVIYHSFNSDFARNTIFEKQVLNKNTISIKGKV